MRLDKHSRDHLGAATGRETTAHRGVASYLLTGHR
jgi:hypothetical protein